jgi:hypothetical protein
LPLGADRCGADARLGALIMLPEIWRPFKKAALHLQEDEDHKVKAQDQSDFYFVILCNLVIFIVVVASSFRMPIIIFSFFVFQPF